MEIRTWYETLLLAIAAYRLWRLLAEADLFDRPRRLLVRLGDAWEKEGDPVPAGYRASWAEFLTCPWCFGFWVALGWWGAWQIWPHATLIVAVPLALSAGVGALARVLPSD